MIYFPNISYDLYYHLVKFQLRTLAIVEGSNLDFFSNNNTDANMSILLSLGIFISFSEIVTNIFSINKERKITVSSTCPMYD